VELLTRLNEIGFERPRRAVAALALSSFVFFYLAVALLLAFNEQQQWVPVFTALSVAYAVAFMGVASEWFWGRWFATGLGWSGAVIAVASMIMSGSWSPVLAVYGGLHGLIVLMLGGPKMAARYDLQTAWRERYGMDEFGVDRLRKTVILWALAPKDPGQETFVVIGALLTGLFAVSSIRGVIRLRTWGLAGLALSSVLLLALGGSATSHVLFTSGAFTSSAAFHLARLVPTFAAALLALALVPFAGPALRFVRSRR
jgi:hypothetical protein